MKRFLFIGACVGFLLLPSCKKEAANPYAPYNNGSDSSASSAMVLLPDTTIGGLYQQIFFPTCANSGCHDGTFEPNFTTIESSYYSLVYHSITKNSISDPLLYRVYPYYPNQSMIVVRLTSNLNGNSGFMPLAVNPGSDWPANQTQYIANIEKWISGGARDISGNVSNPTNLVPQIDGMMITAQNSTTPFPRNINGIIQIPNGTTAVDIYFSISDDQLPANQLTVSATKFSLTPSNFSNAVDLLPTVISPVTFTGFDNQPAAFYHKLTITNLSQYWQAPDVIFVSMTVSDNVNTVSLPGQYAGNAITAYYSFQLN